MKVAHSDLFSWVALELTWAGWQNSFGLRQAWVGLLYWEGPSVGSRGQPLIHLSANEIKGNTPLPTACFPSPFSLWISPVNFPEILNIWEWVNCEPQKLTFQFPRCFNVNRLLEAFRKDRAITMALSTCIESRRAVCGLFTYDNLTLKRKS